MQRVVVTVMCRRDRADAEQLQAAATVILADLRNQPAVASGTAPDFTVDVARLDITIADTSQGLDGGATDLVVELALMVGGGVLTTVASEALLAWWRGTLCRRLRRRVGDDAIGPEISGPHVTTTEVPDATEVDLRTTDARSHEPERGTHP
jgi:hypothetical protein